MGHRPTHYEAQGSHWCTCTCGFRSRLHPTREGVDTEYDKHKEQS